MDPNLKMFIQGVFSKKDIDQFESFLTKCKLWGQNFGEMRTKPNSMNDKIRHCPVSNYGFLLVLLSYVILNIPIAELQKTN